MNKTIFLAVLIPLLLLSSASANIDILELGTRYDCIGHFGYVEYKSNSNSTGVILIFIDDSLVKTKSLDMKIRYITGFRCNPTKTLEFPLNETEGNHTILALVTSDKSTSHRVYGYHAQNWWAQEPEDKEEEEEEIKEEDWLFCWGFDNGR